MLKVCRDSFWGITIYFRAKFNILSVDISCMKSFKTCAHDIYDDLCTYQISVQCSCGEQMIYFVLFLVKKR